MREITYAQAVNEAMSEEMRKDENIVLMGEDVGIYGGAFGVSRGMFEEFGEERVLDTPISELVITGCAAGAAMTGMRPIVEIMFSDFITLAMEQLANQAAKNRFQFGGQGSVPMVLRAPGGSGTGAAEQHSQSLEAWVAHVPGLKVVIPSTPYDAKGLLKAAIKDDNPVVFLEQKLLYRTKGEVPEVEDDYIIPLGEADVKREGTDVTIIATGFCIVKALQAAEELAADGINVEVIDPRTLYPLDKAAIYASIEKTRKVVIVTEENKRGAWSGELASLIAEEKFDCLDTKIVRIGTLNTPIPFTSNLESYVLPQKEHIIKAVKSIQSVKATA